MGAVSGSLEKTGSMTWRNDEASSAWPPGQWRSSMTKRGYWEYPCPLDMYDNNVNKTALYEMIQRMVGGRCGGLDHIFQL